MCWRGRRRLPTTLPGSMRASRRSSARRRRSIAFYPPFFLFITAALALLPYGAALVTWQAVTLALCLLAMTAIISPSPRLREDGRDEVASPLGSESRIELLLALAFPAVLVNLGHGQNGFLTAALLGGALAALERRPILAGVLFGLLAYKPQFGLMIPLALAAGGYWRSFAAAAATIAFLAVAATIAFGPDVWRAFFDSTHFMRTVVLEQGDPGWHKMQSLFAWARMWGAPIPLAYALQAMLVTCLGAALIWLWRSSAAYAVKAASLCIATILATPFTFDYDMMALAPAIAFFAANGMVRGFRPWEKAALAALWLVPLVARSSGKLTLIPLGVPVMLVTFILLLRRSTLHFVQPMALSDRFLLK
jgi:alpha-1,2-mannosyltransferase